jgi:carboxylesterase type B
MRSESIKSERIKQIIEDGNLNFGPQADNRTLVSNPAVRRKNGALAPVPVLIGSNSQEGRLFARDQSNVQKYAQTTFRNDSDIVKAVLAAYSSVGKDGLPAGSDAVAQIMTEYSFQCVGRTKLSSNVAYLSQNTAMYANASARTGVPTWRYYVSC